MSKLKRIECFIKENQDDVYCKGIILIERNGFFVGYLDTLFQERDLSNKRSSVIGFYHEERCIDFVRISSDGKIFNCYAEFSGNKYYGHQREKNTLSFENTSVGKACNINISECKNLLSLHEQDAFLADCIHQASLYLGDCNIHGNDDKIWEEYIYDNIVKSRRLISKKLLENYNESNGYMKRKRLHRKK